LTAGCTRCTIAIVQQPNSQPARSVVRHDPPRPATLVDAPTCSNCGGTLDTAGACGACRVRQVVVRMDTTP
jgi:hypothetical protein